MATYINGVTDYIPNIQPFKPDLNFYNTVLQTKESQYEAGFQKINSLYQTLLNSEMLREPDVVKRDKFFKDIHSEIQRISTVDLSLPQNVSAARTVFEPILNDKNIVNDMAYTKMFRKEQQYANSLRNCVDTDKKKCKGWWAAGDTHLNNWAVDYSKTTDSEALRFDTPRYVPWVDVSDKINGLIKDMKLKVKTTSFTKDGRFIVEQTNGTTMTMPLTKFLMGSVGSDPAVFDMYRVLAENQRHSWINQNLPQFNNDPIAAEDAYNVMLDRNLRNIKDDQKTVKNAQNTLDAKIGVVKQKIDQMPNGVSEDNEMVRTLKLLMEEKTVADAAASQVDDVITTVGRVGMFAEDRIAKRKSLDYGLGYNLMATGMYDFADTYSSLTSETELKVNQYKLAAEKHAMDMSLAVFKDRLGRVRDVDKHKMKMEQDRQKAILKGELPPESVPNTYGANRSDMVLKGASTGPTGDKELDKKNNALVQQFGAQLKIQSQKINHQTSAVQQFHKDLANAADNELDPVKKQYAITQLTQLFGSEKGPDGSFSTRQLKSPEKYYNQVVSLSNDKIYNSTFPTFSPKIYNDIQSAKIENEAIYAYQKTTQNNISNLYDYLNTVTGTIKNSSAEDIAMMQTVIDSKTGNTRKAEEIQKLLLKKGINVDLDEAKELREEYQEIFRNHYTQGYTLGDKQTPVVRPYDWQPGMPVNVGGMAAYPTTATVGSGYKTLNQASLDAITMYDWMQKNASKGSYSLYRGAGVTSDQADEAISVTEASRENDLLQYALSTLRKEIPLKDSQGKLTQGMSVTLHPIIMNDRTMRGFSVEIPEPLFNKWKKDQGKGATGSYEDFANFTVVMPESTAPQEVFGRFNPKPIKAIIRNGGTISINHPQGGDLKLYGNDDGTVGVSGNVYFVNEQGVLSYKGAPSVGVNPYIDPDYFYGRLNEEIFTLGQKNLQALMSPYNPSNAGNIRSGDQAQQYIMGAIQRSTQVPVAGQ